MKQVIPETSPESAEGRVIERPDGFYWAAKEGAREYGPFATLREAMQDMHTFEEDEIEEGETLREAEEEMGLPHALDHDLEEPEAFEVP